MKTIIKPTVKKNKKTCFRASTFAPLLFLAAMQSPLNAHAISYGIYDSRGLALGGTTVALAKTHQAQYYNPALLAFHEGREEDSRDGRVIFPSFVLQASENTSTAASAIEDDLDTNLSNAVQAFNSTPDAAAAGSVALYTRDLEEVLQKFVDNDLNVEMFTGLAISEPSDWEGGAFYFGVRVVGLGASSISNDDLALLNVYISGMEMLAAGGATADLPAEIVDENGELIDPTDNFTSSADLGLLTLAEWGVSLSKSFDVFGQKLSIGATPKVYRAMVYREYTEFDTQDLGFDENRRTYVGMNFDLGVAAQIGEHFRVGVAVKDVVPESYESGNGLALNISPRSRFGLAWVDRYFSLGLDYDIAEIEPVAGELPSQDASMGLEITPFSSFAVQFGYRQDLTGIRGDVLSGGIAYQFKKVCFEASYAKSDFIQGASLQVGWAF